MARPLRIQYPGAVYLVTNKGNDKKAIFKDDIDREQFLHILSLSLESYDVALHSFVLMTKHFDLLVETPVGNLSEFMRHFNISYTSYFNRRHKRTGHLYQGRYKSILIEKETYLATVCRYIHLNPIKTGAIKKKPVMEKFHYLMNYKWSSLQSLLSRDSRIGFIVYTDILKEFGGDNSTGRLAYKKRLVTDLMEGLTLKDKIIAQSLLGENDFISQIKEQYLSKSKDREQPAIATVHRYVKQNVIMQALERGLKAPEKQIIGKPGTPRQIAMDVFYRLGGMKNNDIGKLMRLDYSTISQGRKRLQEKKKKDPDLRELVAEIERLCQE